MAQDISLMGAQYSAVPAVLLPKTGGGTARFTDTSGVTATAADVASGKVFVDASGEEQTGTASGGGEWWDTPDPTDGKTHLWIEIPEDMPSNRLTVNFRFSVYGAGTNGGTIDWGDGTETQTGATSNYTQIHTYAEPGNYEIVVTLKDGATGTFKTDSSYYLFGSSYIYGHCLTWVRRIFVGDRTEFAAQNVCYYCANLKRIDFQHRDGSARTYFYSNSMAYCMTLEKIVVPFSNASTSGKKIGDSSMSYCLALNDLTIPEGIEEIGQYVIRYCYSLSSVTLPSTIIKINNSAFYQAYGVSEYHMKPTTPPTLSNSNAFNSQRSDFKIYVPYSEDHSVLDAYKAATNWSSYASKIVEEDAP